MMARYTRNALGSIVVIYAVFSALTGMLGYQKLASTVGALESVISSNLVPVVRMAQFKKAKEEVYGQVLNTLVYRERGLAHDIPLMREDLVKSWNAYYRTGVSGRSEARLAKEIDDALPFFLVALERVSMQLERGEFERARAFLREQLEPVNSRITEATQKIYDQNMAQAENAAAELGRSVHALIMLFCGFVILAVVGAAVLSVVLYKLLMQPLRKMARIAAGIARDRLSHPDRWAEESRKIDTLINMVRDVR